MMGVAIGWAIVTCVFFIIAHAATLWQSFQKSKWTEGVVMQMRPYGDEREGLRLSVLLVSYLVDGVRYIGRYITEREPDFMAPGDAVSVCYQPDRPCRSAVPELGDLDPVAELCQFLGRSCFLATIGAVVGAMVCP